MDSHEWDQLFKLMAKVNADFQTMEDQKSAVEDAAKERGINTVRELEEFIECMEN